MPGTQYFAIDDDFQKIYQRDDRVKIIGPTLKGNYKWNDKTAKVIDSDRFRVRCRIRDTREWFLECYVLK
ncbi:MAG: hypothetical protein ABIH71_01365, partial [Candidatus Omnitrophota bacterium]